MKKERNNQKQGISLIVLVITIIVIIILAVAVILSIANNNPIENAKKAKEAHNNAVGKEKMELLKQEKLMKQSLSTMTEDEVNKELIKENYPNLKDEDFGVSRGKTVYVGEDEKIKEELQEGLGVLTVKKDILEYVNQITDTSLIVNDCYLTGLVDKSGETPAMYTVETLLAKLPAGSKILKPTEGEEEFTYSEAGTSDKIGTNFKIQDKDGNDMLYTVFFGDLEGNGRSNMIDFAIVRNVLSGGSMLYYNNKATRYAIDVNEDEKITSADYDFMLANLRGGAIPPYTDCLNQFRPIIHSLSIE